MFCFQADLLLSEMDERLLAVARPLLDLFDCLVAVTTNQQDDLACQVISAFNHPLGRAHAQDDLDSMGIPTSPKRIDSKRLIHDPVRTDDGILVGVVLFVEHS